MIDTGATVSIININIFAVNIMTPCPTIPIQFSNEHQSSINHYIKLHIEFYRERYFLFKFYCAQIPYTMVIGMDILSKFYPFLFESGAFIFTHNNFPIRIDKSPFRDTLHSFFALKCVDKCNERFHEWFRREHAKYDHEFNKLSENLKQFTSDNPLAFWEKPKITIKLPTVPNATPTKASHTGMSPSDFADAQVEIDTLLKQGLIRPSKSPWACKAFFVNNHAEQKRGKKRLVINYKPLNKFLIANKIPLPRKDSLLAQLKDAQIFSKFDLKSGF